MHRRTLAIAADHPAFAGHFPGQPLLPGVVLLAEVLETALAEPALARLVGDSPVLPSAKFLAPVWPGDLLTIELDAAPQRLRFEVRCGERLCAAGQFDTGAP